MKECIWVKKFGKLMGMERSVWYGDVRGVVVSMEEKMMMELEGGKEIDLGELGKLGVEVRSEGGGRGGEFKSEMKMKGVKMEFMGGRDVGKMLVGMEFEEVG